MNKFVLKVVRTNARGPIMQDFWESFVAGITKLPGENPKDNPLAYIDVRLPREADVVFTSGRIALKVDGSVQLSERGFQAASEQDQREKRKRITHVPTPSDEIDWPGPFKQTFSQIQSTTYICTSPDTAVAPHLFEFLVHPSSGVGFPFDPRFTIPHRILVYTKVATWKRPYDSVVPRKEHERTAWETSSVAYPSVDALYDYLRIHSLQHKTLSEVMCRVRYVPIPNLEGADEERFGKFYPTQEGSKPFVFYEASRECFVKHIFKCISAESAPEHRESEVFSISGQSEDFIKIFIGYLVSLIRAGDLYFNLKQKRRGTDPEVLHCAYLSEEVRSHYHASEYLIGMEDFRKELKDLFQAELLYRRRHGTSLMRLESLVLGKDIQLLRNLNFILTLQYCILFSAESQEAWFADISEQLSDHIHPEFLRMLKNFSPFQLKDQIRDHFYWGTFHAFLLKTGLLYHIDHLKTFFLYIQYVLIEKRTDLWKDFGFVPPLVRSLFAQRGFPRELKLNAIYKHDYRFRVIPPDQQWPAPHLFFGFIPTASSFDDAIFDSIKIEGIHFNVCSFSWTSFQHTQIISVEFENIYSVSAHFERAIFVNVKFSNSVFKKAKFKSAQFRAVQINSLIIAGCDLRDTDLSGLILEFRGTLETKGAWITIASFLTIPLPLRKYFHKVLFALGDEPMQPEWEVIRPVSTENLCTVCKNNFTPLDFYHHCRLCGKLVHHRCAQLKNLHKEILGIRICSNCRPSTIIP